MRLEPGAERVADALVDGCAIGAVNFAEVLTKLADVGHDPDQVRDDLVQRGGLGQSLVVIPFDEEHARSVAHLRDATRVHGLSPGDRACLALALILGLPILTADRAWSNLDVGATIEIIR